MPGPNSTRDNGIRTPLRGLGSFIQVLASGRPIGRIFHVSNIYRFPPGDEAQRGESDLQDEDGLESLKDKILAKYSAGGRA